MGRVLIPPPPPRGYRQPESPPPDPDGLWRGLVLACLIFLFGAWTMNQCDIYQALPSEDGTSELSSIAGPPASAQPDPTRRSLSVRRSTAPYRGMTTRRAESEPERAPNLGSLRDLVLMRSGVARPAQPEPGSPLVKTSVSIAASETGEGAGS